MQTTESRSLDLLEAEECDNKSRSQIGGLGEKDVDLKKWHDVFGTKGDKKKKERTEQRD